MFALNILFADAAANHHDRLTRFYEKYNKDKISTVKKTLLKYKGDENTLFSYLVEKYGREPGTIDPKDEL